MKTFVYVCRYAAYGLLGLCLPGKGLSWEFIRCLLLVVTIDLTSKIQEHYWPEYPWG